MHLQPLSKKERSAWQHAGAHAMLQWLVRLCILSSQSIEWLQQLSCHLHYVENSMLKLLLCGRRYVCHTTPCTSFCFCPCYPFTETADC